MDPLYALPSLLSSDFTRFFGLWPLLYYGCLHPTLPLMFSCFRLIIPCVLPTWYHLLYIYVLLYACVYDTVFNTCLWFGFIDTRVFIFARHLALASPLAKEFWLPWILMSRSWSLEPVDSPSYWPERCSGSVDPQQTVQSPILPGPPARLSGFSSTNSWAPFVLFILVHLSLIHIWRCRRRG